MASGRQAILPVWAEFILEWEKAYGLHGSLAGGGTFLEWDLVGKGGNYSGRRHRGRGLSVMAGGAFQGGIPAPSAAPSNRVGVDGRIGARLTFPQWEP